MTATHWVPGVVSSRCWLCLAKTHRKSQHTELKSSCEQRQAAVCDNRLRVVHLWRMLAWLTEAKDNSKRPTAFMVERCLWTQTITMNTPSSGPCQEPVTWVIEIIRGSQHSQVSAEEAGPVLRRWCEDYEMSRNHQSNAKMTVTCFGIYILNATGRWKGKGYLSVMLVKISFHSWLTPVKRGDLGLPPSENHVFDPTSGFYQFRLGLSAVHLDINRGV